MYEDEQLANQKMVLDETVKVVKGVVNFVEHIDNRFGTKKEKSSKNTTTQQTTISNQVTKALDHTELPFEFTGQHTDLSYFLYHNSMPLQAVNDIQDTELRKAVNFVMKDAEKDGYVNIENDIITITDKGKEHISTHEFQQQIQPNIDNFRKRRNKSSSATEVQQFEWIGADSDLLFFKDNQSLDLKQLLGYDACIGELRKKVTNQLNNYVKKGILNISENGVATITDVGKKLIDSLSIGKSVAMKNVPKIILQVAKVVKKAVETNVNTKTGGKSL